MRPSENGDTVGQADVRETETGKPARKECYRGTASSLLWAGGLAAFALYMLWGMFFRLIFLPIALLKILQACTPYFSDGLNANCAPEKRPSDWS